MGVAGSVLGIGKGEKETRSRIFRNTEEFAKMIMEGCLKQGPLSEQRQSEKHSGVSGATTGKRKKRKRKDKGWQGMKPEQVEPVT